MVRQMPTRLQVGLYLGLLRQAGLPVSEEHLDEVARMDKTELSERISALRFGLDPIDTESLTDAVMSRIRDRALGRDPVRAVIEDEEQ